MVQRDVEAFQTMHPWEQRLVIRHRPDLVWRLDVLTSTQKLELDGARQGMRKALAREVIWEAAHTVSQEPLPECLDARRAVTLCLCHTLAFPADNADTQFRNDVFVHELLVLHERCTADWREAVRTPQVQLPAVRAALQTVRSVARCAQLSDVLHAFINVVLPSSDVNASHAGAECAQEPGLVIPPGIGDFVSDGDKESVLHAPPRTAHANVASAFLRDVAAMLLARQACAV